MASEQFIEQYTASQPQLLGYVMAAIGNLPDSQDVLQKANLTMWRKAETFDSSRAFMPWAIGFLRTQILSYYRDRKRERLLFDDDVVEKIQAIAETNIDRIADRDRALGQCLTKLKDDHRAVLALRYANRKSMEQIAEICGRSVDGVKSLLKRLRDVLTDCLEKELRSSTNI